MPRVFAAPGTSLRAALFVVSLFVVSLLSGSTAFAAPCSPRFVRGDANTDGAVDIADPVVLLLDLFAQGSTIRCFDAADANDDTRLNVSDVVYSLAFLFLGASAPPAPWPGCGIDLTPTDLGCEEYSLCPIPMEDEVCDGMDNDCDGETDEGFDLTSLERCGACDNDCRSLGWAQVAEYRCEEGRCRIERCEDGFYDVDGIALNGCESLQPPNGTPCDDGNPCTENDFYAFGVCGGTPKDCSELADPCNRSACDPETGECYRIPRPDRPCDDGNPNTRNDRCNEEGECIGTGI